MRLTPTLPPRWSVLLAFALLAGSAPGHAQPGCDTTSTTVIGDLTKGELEPLPFDVRFTLRVPVPTLADKTLSIDSVELRYGMPVRTDEGFRLRDNVGKSRRRVTGPVTPTELAFAIEALPPNRLHYFDFIIYAGKESIVAAAGTPVVDTVRVVKFDERTLSFAVRDRFVARGRTVRTSDSVHVIQLRGTPRASFANHFDADAGLLRSGEFGYWGAGTNTHLYARPINRNQCMKDYAGWDHLFKRVSVFGGLSLFEFDSGPEVDHMWSTGSPVVGIGLNRLPVVPIRINSGIIWLRQDDPNPLVTRSGVKRDYFISGGIDVELKTLVAPLAALANIK